LFQLDRLRLPAVLQPLGDALLATGKAARMHTWLETHYLRAGPPEAEGRRAEAPAPPAAPSSEERLGEAPSSEHALEMLVRLFASDAGKVEQPAAGPAPSVQLLRTVQAQVRLKCAWPCQRHARYSSAVAGGRFDRASPDRPIWAAAWQCGHGASATPRRVGPSPGRHARVRAGFGGWRRPIPAGSNGTGVVGFGLHCV